MLTLKKKKNIVYSLTLFQPNPRYKSLKIVKQDKNVILNIYNVVFYYEVFMT